MLRVQLFSFFTIKTLLALAVLAPFSILILWWNLYKCTLNYFIHSSNSLSIYKHVSVCPLHYSGCIIIKQYIHTPEATCNQYTQTISFRYLFKFLMIPTTWRPVMSKAILKWHKPSGKILAIKKQNKFQGSYLFTRNTNCIFCQTVLWRIGIGYTDMKLPIPKTTSSGHFLARRLIWPSDHLISLTWPFANLLKLHGHSVWH